MDSYCYRLHDTEGDDLDVIQHPAPNVEPGDVVVLADGREALVTAGGGEAGAVRGVAGGRDCSIAA